MQKNLKAVIALIVLVVLVVGGIIIFNKKTPKPVASNSTNKTSSRVNTATSAIVETKTSANAGIYLTDSKGDALYTYTKDSSGVSNCSGGCLSAWPAYIDDGPVTGLPPGISTIKRTDNGELQYTYKSLPLYFFSGDTSGKVTGNGVAGFNVARP